MLGDEPRKGASCTQDSDMQARVRLLRYARGE